MNFGELNIDGLIDEGALTIAISEADLRKIRLLAGQTVLNEGPPPDFQVIVTNGHLETPSARTEHQYEAGDMLFKDCFIVVTNITSPLLGLLFLQRNSTIVELLASRNLQFVFHFHATQKRRQHVLKL